MSILKNAIDSIAVGLEDYESGDERRIISSVRNTYSGVLLLFKYKLVLLSPENSDESLIKQKLKPIFGGDGTVQWVGDGNKTVDYYSIKDRFKALGLSVDWTEFDKVNKYRNEVEHYYSELKPKAVQQIISSCFILIRNFVSEHLEMDPMDLLGEDSWRVMLDANEVYEAEKKKCKSSFLRLSFLSPNIQDSFNKYCCSSCGSDLVEAVGDSFKATDYDFRCRVCGQTENYEECIKKVISEYFSSLVYFAATDGADQPLIDCPSCVDGAYIMEDRICSSCGYNAQHQCDICGSEIPASEISEDNHCGYCAYMLDKIMRE